MKKILLIFCLFFYLCTCFLYAQELDWYEYELEKTKVGFPSEDVYQLDTIVNGIKLKTIFTTFNNTTLILQISRLENISTEENSSNLPSDYKSLIKYYEETIEGMKNSLKAIKTKSKVIEFGNFIAYNTIYYNTDQQPFYETNTFLIGDYMIVVFYYKKGPFDIAVKEHFFNSLKLEKLDASNQYIGKSKANKKE